MPKRVKFSEASIDMLRVAQLFYREKWNKQRIAESLNIDVRKVGATLERALQAGLVRIFIGETLENSLPEQQIKAKYPHMQKVLILPLHGRIETEQQYIGLLQRFGMVAASLLDDLIDRHGSKGPFRVGISGGETLLEFVNAVPDRLRRDLHVHATSVVPHGQPVMYASGVDPSTNATILWAKSGRIAGQCHYTTITPYDTDKTGIEARELIQTQAKMLSENPKIKAVIEEMRYLNVVFTGLGTLTSPAPEYSFMNKRLTTMGLLHPLITLEDFAQDEAVGDISYCLVNVDGKSDDKWRFFPAVGDHSDYPGVSYYRHMVEMEKPVIAIAGPFRLAPIKAVLRGKLVNILITDEDTAQQIVAGD
ncbi:MAG: sugar-binding domain-containing protein [Acidobacteriaceae bacterium]|jgi:DNA-binding transcriptional regulator LsrR (DeoR family)